MVEPVLHEVLLVHTCVGVGVGVSVIESVGVGVFVGVGVGVLVGVGVTVGVTVGVGVGVLVTETVEYVPSKWLISLQVLPVPIFVTTTELPLTTTL